ncbi:hypothetical protein, partial [Bacillus cereus]|uniref:hypothetical protein n=1 Tax=Bacillus cereus TaxID=1396 RepID=UPI002852758B
TDNVTSSTAGTDWTADSYTLLTLVKEIIFFPPICCKNLKQSFRGKIKSALLLINHKDKKESTYMYSFTSSHLPSLYMACWS